MSPEPRRRILIIDDEVLLTRSFSRILERDYEVTALTSAEDALRQAVEGSTWDFILCDLQMPTMDGVEFFARLGEIEPDLCNRVTFVSGGAYTPRVQAFVLRTSRPVVDKPLSASDLRQLIERETHHRRTGSAVD